MAAVDDDVQALHPEFANHGDHVCASDWQGNAVRVYDAKTFEMVPGLGDVTTPTGIFDTSRHDETLGHYCPCGAPPRSSSKPMPSSP